MAYSFIEWLRSAWFKAFNFVGLIKIHVNGMSVIWDSIHQKFPPAQDVAIESLLWFCVLIKLCFPINAPCQKLGWCTNVSHAHGLDHVWSLKGAISDHFSLSLYHWPFNSHLGNPSLTLLLLVLYDELFFWSDWELYSSQKSFLVILSFRFLSFGPDLAWIEEARFLPLNLQRRAAAFVALFIHIHMCFSICLLPGCLPIGYFMCCVCPTEMHSFLFWRCCEFLLIWPATPSQKVLPI